jgi:hypothetical protein
MAPQVLSAPEDRKWRAASSVIQKHCGSGRTKTATVNHWVCSLSLTDVACPDLRACLGRVATRAEIRGLRREIEYAPGLVLGVERGI